MTTPEHDKRLWEFTLHEDLLFNERQNFFLIAESMLAVAYATALASARDIARDIAIIALVITIMWLYVSARHAQLVESIQKRAKAAFPDYAAIAKEREELRPKLRSRNVVAYGVPAVICVLWVILLAARL
jgi:hypothetical protein